MTKGARQYLLDSITCLVQQLQEREAISESTQFDKMPMFRVNRPYIKVEVRSYIA